MIFRQKFGIPPSIPLGTPEIVASIVSYLVKPEAFFVTGMSILADSLLNTYLPLCMSASPGQTMSIDGGLIMSWKAQLASLTRLIMLPLNIGFAKWMERNVLSIPHYIRLTIEKQQSTRKPVWMHQLLQHTRPDLQQYSGYSTSDITCHAWSSLPITLRLLNQTEIRVVYV